MTYLDDIGDEIRAKVPKGRLPDEDTRDLFRMYAVLLLAKGVMVETADVHNAWVAWMAGRDPNHEALLPLDQLDLSVIAEDEPYVAAIRDVANKWAW